MATYTAKQGDTFELISRRMFGTETETGKLRRANPSLTEPFTAGDSVFIPSEPKKNTVNGQSDDVTVLIDGKEFQFFTDIEFQNKFNSFDTCTLTAPMDSENKLFRETFKPFAYKPVEIHIGNTLIFSGTQMSVTPIVAPDSKVVIMEAYARCAVINDSSVPVSAYPIELRGMKLDRIAENVCRPFPFKVIKKTDVGATFETAAITHSAKIASFLTTLCKQRDLILTNDCNGDLLITKALESESVAHLSNNAPVLSVTPTYDEQSYSSDYTVILPVIVGLPIASYTAKNKKLNNVLRVDNFMANDATNGEERKIAESRRARGLANSISYNVELATIRDPQGNLYEPNTYINLIAPDAFIYTDTKFFVRQVAMQLSGSEKRCMLDLVLPESYNGKDVEVFPWDE